MANITLKNFSGGKTSITADEFLGTSSYTKLLQLYDSSNGSSTGIGNWIPDANYTYVYKQGWANNNMNADSGDLCLGLRNNGSGGVELCMFIDGDYYSMGNKVLNAGNFSSYALPLAGGTMNGTIWSAHVMPKTTMSYNLGSADYEYGETFSRTIFVRHIEPAKNVNNDILLNYNSRNGYIRAYSALSMEGISNIVNLPIEGGLYWNPYVESSTDNSDAASITVHANGIGGGTELRITMANDGNDVINLNSAEWIYLGGKAAFRISDNWLRINETGGFSSGVYFGHSITRTDYCLQVGDSGNAFIARNDGYGRFSSRLEIGSQLALWADGEGGNIWIASGNGHTNSWEMDSFDGNFRVYTYRESDGEYRGNTLYQEDGYWDKCRNAIYATYVKDSYNNSNITITYGKAGQSSTSWLASWNGYELGAIQPSNITAGWASGASYSNSSNALASTGWGNSNFTYLQTSGDFYGNSGWSHYLISNHGDGSSYYNFVIALPFWSFPKYKRMQGGTAGSWYNFHTTENVIIQSSTPGAGFYGQIWLKI